MPFDVVLLDDVLVGKYDADGLKPEVSVLGNPTPYDL